MNHETGPSVVAIAGSCVTRDNFNSRFNPDYKLSFRVDLSANQSSMIAMMSPSVDPVFEPTKDMSDYDRWNVGSDMSRELVRTLPEVQPDYLILDFFGDVHFGVLRLADGRYLTDNSWKLWHTDVYERMVEGEDYTRIKMQTDPDEYFALWTEAMDRFAIFVAETCPSTTVIVNCGRYTDRVAVPDRSVPVKITKHRSIHPIDVALGNQLWARLDDHCTAAYGWASIDLRDEEFTSVADHPWGVFWVHYTEDYYHRFLAELHSIHLRRSGDVDLTRRLDEIEVATRESVSRRLRIRDARDAGRRKQLAERTRRVAELEGLGVLKSAKFALGQRRRAARSRRQG